MNALIRIEGLRREFAMGGETVAALLLADEPTGNLDTRTGEDVMALFAGLHAEEQTILVVTHDAEVAAHAQRPIVLRDGGVESDTRSGAPAGATP